jgi:VWFA-related protein
MLRPLWLASIALFLQQPPQLPQPTFATDVGVVLVDVHVVDSDGNPILDLRPDDFEVRIDGRVRAIESAQLIRYAPEPSAQRESGGSAGPRPPRMFVIAVDEHSLPVGGAVAAVKAAEKFIDRLQPDDLVGLYAYPTGLAQHDLTLDHESVRRALQRITGLLDEPAGRFDMTSSEIIDIASGDADALDRVAARECPRSSPGCTSREIKNEAISLAGFIEMQVSQSVGGLRALLRGLGDVPGRKMLVLVSGGLVMTDRGAGRANAAGEIAALGRDAAAANVSMFALHLDWTFITSLSAQGGSRSSFFRDSNLATAGLELAAATAGGAVTRVMGGNPDAAFDRVLRETAAHYLLGVDGRDDYGDGMPHTIRVSVNRRGARVRSRTQLIVRPEPATPHPSRAAAMPAPSTPIAAIVPPGGVPPVAVSEPETPRAVATKITAPLDGVLSAAAAFVVDYQAQLSAVVYEERYRQRADRDMAPPPIIRELRSDMLLVADRDYGWVEFRDVFEVDHRPVRDRSRRLEQLFLEPGIDPLAQADRIVQESTRYNLQHPELVVERSVNMPLLVLRFLAPENHCRFRFTKDGVESIEGRRTVRIKFQEEGLPRMIRTPDDTPASGHIWLDPETGVVHRTELSLHTGGSRAPVDVRIRVGFAPDEKIGLLVPRWMEEEYVRGSIRVSGRADYTNFRRFNVATSSEIKK